MVSWYDERHTVWVDKTIGEVEVVAMERQRGEHRSTRV
jgi:hypothetical protein